MNAHDSPLPEFDPSFTEWAARTVRRLRSIPRCDPRNCLLENLPPATTENQA